MRKLVLVAALLCASITFAQQGINYKALIKDANNAVVANQSITVQFSILQGVAQTNVYQETHTPTTDANGIIIVNIGEGTVDSGVFNDIDWASDDHFLNTQINTGSGLIDMGTTGFKTVPYALSAKTAESAANVTGLETIDEGNGNGLVKVGRDPARYGDVGANAVDLSFSSSSSTTRGATGSYSIATGWNTTSGPFSTAMGLETVATGVYSLATGQYSQATGDTSTAIGVSNQASGNYSTALGYFSDATGVASSAMGLQTTASGNYSTAMGSGSTASGRSSSAMGENSTASGQYSTALGYGILSESLSNTAVGSFNIGGGDPTNWIDLDPLFEVGNGDFSNRSNALTILKNGTITASSFDISEITDDKALITKEYADANYTDTGTAPTGLEAIDEGNGNGLVKVGRNPANYGDVGVYAVDLSYQDQASTTRGATGNLSTAMGYNTTASATISTAMGSSTAASGIGSTAMGRVTSASGDHSTAMGLGTVASGNSSTTMGSSTQAAGDSSTAMGRLTEASGVYSTAMGQGTLALARNSLAIGYYNVGGGNAISIVGTDPLFEIGNGTSSNRSNALTVLKNGTITAPSFNISEITDNKALVTKEYVDTNSGGSGLEAIDEGNGAGWRLIGRDPANYGNVGENAVDLSDSNGSSTTRGAIGTWSFAIGLNSTASGNSAIAMGESNTASGTAAVAIGVLNNTTGNYSTSIGRNNLSSGIYATSIGFFATAQAYISTVMGRYNVISGSTTVWNPSDPLFVLGNGSSSSNRSNALTVLKNGNATLAGSLTQNSDFRLKKNILPLENSLTKLLKLEGKNYYWNNIKPHSEGLQIGLIAQEVETVFPELVHTGSDGYKSVDYTSLIPVLIEATKTQQDIIVAQAEKIESLEKKTKALASLEARLSALETANANEDDVSIATTETAKD